MVELGPTLADYRPDLVEVWANMVEFGPSSAAFGPNVSVSYQHLVDIRRRPSDMDRIWPRHVRWRIWPIPDHAQPKCDVSARQRPNSTGNADFSRVSTVSPELNVSTKRNFEEHEPAQSPGSVSPLGFANLLWDDFSFLISTRTRKVLASRGKAGSPKRGVAQPQCGSRPHTWNLDGNRCNLRVLRRQTQIFLRWAWMLLPMFAVLRALSGRIRPYCGLPTPSSAA